MGSIIVRGTRDNPKYFIKFREADGTQKMKLTNQRTWKKTLTNRNAANDKGAIHSA